jgi:hypothetical protein
MNTIVRHLRSSHALKGQTVLLILKIHPVVVSVQGPPMDGDNRHTYIHTNTLCSSTANAFCAAFFSLTDLEQRRRIWTYQSVLRPGHFQQNVQSIWWSPLTQTWNVGCTCVSKAKTVRMAVLFMAYPYTQLKVSEFVRFVVLTVVLMKIQVFCQATPGWMIITHVSVVLCFTTC